MENRGDKSVSFDLESIRIRGKLIAVTDINSTNYFIYRGEPMGFSYDLLKSFSDYLGIDIDIVTVESIDQAIDMLKSGQADLLAIGLAINSSRKKDIQYSIPIDETRQVLVQRRPASWRLMTSDDIDKKLIRNQLGLAKKTVYVQRGSSHFERLQSLAGEIGDSIKIVEMPYDSEKLIKDVADGKIDYTVSDENIAQVNSSYYPDIDVSTPISFPQHLAWAVRKNNSDALLAELNSWISAFKHSQTYAYIHARYFNNSRSNMIFRSESYTLNSGKVSEYDDLIKKFSNDIKWDWRLLAALICQESGFHNDAISGAGAYGLMQIMPGTGENFGIDITSSPQNNVKAGTLYINWLHSIFDQLIPDEKERISFILASYNAGPGHILDAMELARKHGKDPQKWEGNVAVWLLKKSDPRYYNDIVVKSGYFKGTESVAFVSEILDRYEHYKNIVPAGESH
jgi:membrane-bound lytic murein transglycosylase F